MADPLDLDDVFGDDGVGTDAHAPGSSGPRPLGLPAAVPLPGPAPRARRRTLDPTSIVNGVPRLAADSRISGSEIHKLDPRGTAWPSPSIDRSSFLTIGQLAKELKVQRDLPYRWCRTWFGALPPGHASSKSGYLIPREYRYVARAWLQVVQDCKLREQIRWAIIDGLRPWVVVCGLLASTHHSHAEVISRLQSFQTSSNLARALTTILHVGPILPEDVDLQQ